MAVAIIIFFIDNQDWTLYFQHANFIQILYFSLPYLWFFILLGLIILAYFNFKKTEFCYRYSFKKLVIIYFLSSIILGYLFYFLGFAQILNNTFDQKIPFYQNLHQKCSWFWQDPEAGRLAGEIIMIKDTNMFRLKDLENKEWTIYDQQIQYENKSIRKEGMNIRIMGKMKNDQQFIADEIKPFMHQNMPHKLFRVKQRMTNERNN